MSENKIINKLIEHDKRFDQMIAKDEFGNFRNELLTNLDNMTAILEKLDQERVFTGEWVKRIEKQVEKNTQEIAKIRQSLSAVN